MDRALLSRVESDFFRMPPNAIASSNCRVGLIILGGDIPRSVLLKAARISEIFDCVRQTMR
jgi:hypothetical protein